MVLTKLLTLHTHVHNNTNLDNCTEDIHEFHEIRRENCFNYILQALLTMPLKSFIWLVFWEVNKV